MMLKPADVVLADFWGAKGVKRRPCVVVSTDSYQTHRSDVIVALLTAQLHEASTPMDHVLQDWAKAGLNRATAFRLYVNTVQASAAVKIGHVSDRDWQDIQARLRLGLAVT